MPKVTIDLTPAGFDGVMAIVRQPERGSFPKGSNNPEDPSGFSYVAATELVRRHLIAIEGMEMHDEESPATPWSTVEPYDHSNPRHFRSLSLDMCNAIYDALLMMDPVRPQTTG